jgi:probable H4MPT-linked C1 transfer pathway protein
MVGLDIGGANLKAADRHGRSVSRPFALWRAPERLAAELTELLRPFAPIGTVLATMTGELCDCYPTKADGVRHIVESLQEAVAHLDGGPVLVWSAQRRFVAVEDACHHWLDVAAANWMALAQWAARHTRQRCGVLIDVGSTTTDCIPLAHGQVLAQGKTDAERLAAGELLYMGLRRTPVCSVVDALPWKGRWCPVARELFATTWDAFLLTEIVPEEPQRLDTADGQPATRAAAWARMARMVCGDTTLVSYAEAQQMAEVVVREVYRRVEELLSDQLARFQRQCVDVGIICGEGEFLAQQVLERVVPGIEVIRLSSLAGPQASRAACAWCLVQLYLDQQ